MGGKRPSYRRRRPSSKKCVSAVPRAWTPGPSACTEWQSKQVQVSRIGDNSKQTWHFTIQPHFRNEPACRRQVCRGSKVHQACAATHTVYVMTASRNFSHHHQVYMRQLHCSWPPKQLRACDMASAVSTSPQVSKTRTVYAPKRKAAGHCVCESHAPP